MVANERSADTPVRNFGAASLAECPLLQEGPPEAAIITHAEPQFMYLWMGRVRQPSQGLVKVAFSSFLVFPA